MSVFDKIKNAIWGTAHAAPAPKPAAAPAAPATPTATQTASSPTPTAAPAPSSSGTAAPQTAQTSAPSAQPTAAPQAGAGQAPQVDVSAILEAAVAKKGEKLDWRHSIVDLMKALDLDSSLTNRKELAKELNYTGDTSDSATMNIWLHKALMKKLADNGGKVPAELTD